MSMTDFSDAMLLNANFTGTDLRGAKFHGANLIGCNFSGARMGPMPISTLEGRRWHTSLEDANLGQANLAGCQLDGAKFDRAILMQADLRGAKDRKSTRLNSSH